MCHKHVREFCVFSGQRGDVWQGEVWRPVLDDDEEEELQGGTKWAAAIWKRLFQALLFIQPPIWGSLPTGDDTRGGKRCWHRKPLWERLDFRDLINTWWTLLLTLWRLKSMLILFGGMLTPQSMKYKHSDTVEQERRVIFCYKICIKCKHSFSNTHWAKDLR